MKNTVEILDLSTNDKPLKPGSYRGRKNTAPEKNSKLMEKIMLKAENKIFKISIIIMMGMIMQLEEMTGKTQKILFLKAENG